MVFIRVISHAMNGVAALVAEGFREGSIFRRGLRPRTTGRRSNMTPSQIVDHMMCRQMHH